MTRIPGINDHSGKLFPVWIVLGALFLFSGTAEAIPAFAKKYSAPCALCHTSWPLLNDVGYKFKLNAYQMEGTRDGAEAGKITPSFDLHLDTGKANPPLSLRLDGGFSVFQPKSGPDNPTQANNFPCCTEGNRLKMYAAGTIDQDAGYYIAYKFGDTQIEQGYIRFVNMFGAGYVGVDLGALRTADLDAVSPYREWFGGVSPAFFGTTNTGGRDQGMGVGYTDTGARFFGNPDNGPFSYDVIIATGSRAVGNASNSRGSAFGFMGRVDIGGFAGSFRYWTNKSGELVFKKGAGAGYYSSEVGQTAASATEFAPSRTSPDEKTNDYLFTLRYDDERWQTDLVYEWNDFSMDSRTNGANSYVRESVRRTGWSLDWIYRFSSRIAFGARYGASAVPGFNETYNGAVTNVPSFTAAQYDLKVEMLPVQNARVTLQWTMDSSNAEARTDLSGRQYDLQSKLFLLWDWAI